MKKKLLLVVGILLVSLFIGYRFLYQSHRDISNEAAAVTTTTTSIIAEFTKDEATANKKYLDKTIEVTGKVSEIDAANKTIVLDEKLFCMMNELANDVKVGESISVKGRLIGFDELLEELKMDQITVIK